MAAIGIIRFAFLKPLIYPLELPRITRLFLLFKVLTISRYQLFLRYKIFYIL